jgi:hypothetical protein
MLPLAARVVLALSLPFAPRPSSRSVGQESAWLPDLGAAAGEWWRSLVGLDSSSWDITSNVLAEASEPAALALLGALLLAVALVIRRRLHGRNAAARGHAPEVLKANQSSGPGVIGSVGRSRRSTAA